MTIVKICEKSIKLAALPKKLPPPPPEIFPAYFSALQISDFSGNDMNYVGSSHFCCDLLYLIRNSFD